MVSEKKVKDIYDYDFDHDSINKNLDQNKRIPEYEHLELKKENKFLKIAFGILTVIIVFFLFAYYFLPQDIISFHIRPVNPNFIIDNSSIDMQFYPNMRFPSNEISYSISDDCNLNKKSDMREAFDILENKTILKFYTVSSGGEIFVECQESSVIEGGLFIAGEGGPTDITESGEFNVISSGKILLIRNSNCYNPNIAIHELLHVLGFKHSNNPENIMYNFSRCDQEIGEDMINLTNYLYSFPSLPDLTFESAQAQLQGNYLNLNLSIRNQGLKKAPESTVKIYTDDKEIKSFTIEELDIGYGKKVSISNIFIIDSDIKKVKLVIENPSEEITKGNSKVILDVDNS